MFKTGFGKVADTLIRSLAEEFHDQGALHSIAVFDIGGATMVRGMNGSNRLDGYGLTKRMVELTRSELRRLGHKLTFDEVDGLLHHAEEHRSGQCVCRSDHFGGRDPLTDSQRHGRLERRRVKDGTCRRCGAVPPTNGTVCRGCLDNLVALRREQRARKRSSPQLDTCYELPY